MPSNGRFTSENAAANGRKGLDSKPKAARTQAVELQKALARAGQELEKDMLSSNDKTERTRIAGALASVAKGWQAMNDQLRVMRGVPLPGSRRPERENKTTVKSSKLVLPKQGEQRPEEQNVVNITEGVKHNRIDTDATIATTTDHSDASPSPADQANVGQNERKRLTAADHAAMLSRAKPRPAAQPDQDEQPVNLPPPE